MIDRFSSLLQELNTQWGTSLHPDPRGACKLNVDQELHVQLECDASQEKLLIATFVCDIPPGKFRENVLRDALKHNSPFPKGGVLSYSDKNNKLVLFRYLSLEDLNGDKLAEFLVAFVEKARQWRMGVETGHTARLVGDKSGGISESTLRRV